jgi:hypothetical protein
MTFRAMSLVGILGLLAFGCGGSDSSSLPFTCGTMTCNAATQYCDQRNDANGATVSQTCAPLPTTGCTGEPYCDSCFSTTAIATRTGCSRLPLGTNPAQYFVSRR